MPLRSFTTSAEGNALAGVCAGIAQALGVDVTLVRLVFALLALAGGAGIVLYLALWAWSAADRPRWAILLLLVPYTLFGTSWIFSRAGFKGWCVVSFVWVWVGMVICVIWPLVESWGTISRIVRGLVGKKG